MEAEVFLTLFIKLVGGETEAGEHRPGWMRVLDGDHARVRYLSILILCYASSTVTRLCSDADFRRSI
jgi:hypothetical protein